MRASLEPYLIETSAQLVGSLDSVDYIIKFQKIQGILYYTEETLLPKIPRRAAHDHAGCDVDIVDALWTVWMRRLSRWHKLCSKIPLKYTLPYSA